MKEKSLKHSSEYIRNMMDFSRKKKKKQWKHITASPKHSVTQKAPCKGTHPNASEDERSEAPLGVLYR